MKKILAIVLVSLMVFSIVGCTKDDPNNGENGQGITVNKIDYKVVEDINSLSEDLVPIAEGAKSQRGFINFKNETYNYILISSGEKPTGGYGITIKSVEDVEGTASIVIEETAPEKDAMVTEALTYPYIILDMPMESQSFRVTNEAGEELKSISINEVILTETGIYVGQIDNNFIEVTTESGPNVFMISDETRDAIGMLDENTHLELTYYKNENGQLVLTEIEATEEDNTTNKTAIGTYVGQIDNTSIEITIDGNPKAFTSYDMAQMLEGIKDGDKVEVEYTEEASGQLMIKSLSKVD